MFERVLTQIRLDFSSYRNDGCFVARMVAMNSTDIVTMDLLNDLFRKYEARENPKEANGDVHGMAEE